MTLQSAKACHVCGSSDTVRAHLFPRALQHDIRKDATHVVRIGLGDPKTRQSQSGEWRDDILCAHHEAELGAADRYGVTFARSYPAQAADLVRGKAKLLANPRPELLVRFMHAVVWRHTAALMSQGISHWLGPYHARIERVLFDGGTPLEGYLMDPAYQSDGERTLIGLNPCPAHMENIRLVRFDIGGLAFHLKTDNRPFPTDIALARLDRDPIVIITKDATEISQDPHLLAVAAAAVRAGQSARR